MLAERSLTVPLDVAWGADVIRISRYIHHVLLSNGAFGAALRLLCFHLDGVCRNLIASSADFAASIRLVENRTGRLRGMVEVVIRCRRRFETLNSIAWTAQRNEKSGGH
jgi:hypothetical protein